MKDNNLARWNENNAILAKLGVVDHPPLKLKYTIRFTPKFGGKKRAQSNSGNVGRAHRARQRRGTFKAIGTKRA